MILEEHNTEQYFSLRGDFTPPPRPANDIWQCVEVFSVVITMVEGATGI